MRNRDSYIKTGNLGIGTANPQAKLNIQGNLRVGQYTLPSVDGQPGQVLGTDGNGNISWVDMGGGGGRKLPQNGAKEPTITTVRKIADVLGVSIDELIGIRRR